MKLFSQLWRREPGFADAMITSFPSSLPPPEPLVLYFRWLESIGADRAEGGVRYALVDPDQPDLTMLIEPVDPAFAVAWLGEDDPSICERFAPFLRTGGDGSYGALWRDDAGKTKFVHHGSGSGSTMLCTLADDPVDFLRLLAIGYDELCWPDTFQKTPEEISAGYAAEDDQHPPFRPRHRMRAWVEATFGVRVPSTASAIVSSIADMDQDESDDPFWKWIRQLQVGEGKA